MKISRREGLALLAASATMLGSSGHANIPIAMPSDLLLSFVRMRGMRDGRIAIGYLSGRYSGVVDGALTPLFGVVSATFTAYTVADDGYDITGFEQAYFTDLDTGEVLGNWKNPYTDEIVSVPQTSLPPMKAHIGPDLRFRTLAAMPPGVTFNQFALPPEVIGDEIFFVENIFALQAVAKGNPAFRYNDSTIMRSRVADLAKRQDAPVPCETSFQAVVSWRPWLKMGAHSGHMLAFGVGRYGVGSVDELPRNWIVATRLRRPEILTHPEKGLVG